jgi:ABC-type dipeptide/oligopeptide/nickel transport system ATPase component
MPPGCAFAPRCDYAKDICFKQMPTATLVDTATTSGGHVIRCFNSGDTIQGDTK